MLADFLISSESAVSCYVLYLFGVPCWRSLYNDAPSESSEKTDAATLRRPAASSIKGDDGNFMVAITNLE